VLLSYYDKFEKKVSAMPRLTENPDPKTIGRPSEISDQTIVDTGRRLAAAGVKVTGYSLRKSIGSGDARRLEAVWLAHLEAETPATVEPVSEAPLPPGLEEQRDAAVTQVSDFVVRLFSGSWRVAQDIAQRRMGDEQAVIRKKIAEADQRLADADELIQDMDDRAAAAAEQLSSLATAADEARMNAVRIEERHGTLREAGREAADLAATTIANLKVDLSSAETAAINARQDAGLATATAAAVHAEAERLRIEVDALRLDLNRVRSDKAEVTAQLAAAGAQAKATADELDRERQAGAGAVLKIAETSERAARAEQRATSAEDRGLQADEKIRLLEVAARKLQREVEDLGRGASAS
jgi:hypothetical protein